jgi:hypothetical protein
MGAIYSLPGGQVAAGQKSNEGRMITENDLYAIGMESPTAWAKMEELCKALGIPYPPQQTKESKVADNPVI